MNITVGHDALLAAHKRYIAGVKEGNAGVILSLYSDDVVLMPPNETSILGKAEAEQWLREYFQHFRVADFVPMDRHVTVLGETAVERWSYGVKIRPVDGGETIRDEGRLLTVWERGETGWRMKQSMWNSVQPIGAGTRRFMSLLKQQT